MLNEGTDSQVNYLNKCNDNIGVSGGCAKKKSLFFHAEIRSRKRYIMFFVHNSDSRLFNRRFTL